MHIYMRENPYKFDVEQTAIILFPERSPRVVVEEIPGSNLTEDYGVSSITPTEKGITASFFLQLDGRSTKQSAQGLFPPDADEEARKTETRHTVRRSVYKAFVALTGEKPAWGALSGVRPAKLTRKYMEAGNTEQQTRKILENRYGIRKDRAALALRAAKVSLDLKKDLTHKDAGIYLGIPFCPTRCSYCSFISRAAPKAASEMIAAYLRALLEEMSAVGESLKESGCRVPALYIGGGTPTTLDEEQLNVLLLHARNVFPLARDCELTLEAGRPDTITREKLQVAAENGVNRLSINPQTFSNRVLEAVGRRHTVEQNYDAYELARSFARFQINMDLIAGLPADNLANFADSVTQACNLYPENITVHTLALKRGSALTESGAKQHTPQTIAAMLKNGEEILSAYHYLPYYLYRQKYSGGSFENVGYALGGDICRYNVYMMDELLPVIGCGAGAVTKLGFDTGEAVVRLNNPKYPEDYLARKEEIIGKKEEIKAFFSREPVMETGVMPTGLEEEDE